MYAKRKGWLLEGVQVKLNHEKIHASDCNECVTEEGKLDQITKTIFLKGDLTQEQRERLLEIAERCPVNRTLTTECHVVGVGFYGGAFKVTEGLFAEFGEKRVVDTPIAEGLIVGAAVGAAMVGLRPIAELMTVNFALLAMDQIVNHAAKIHYMFGGKARVPLVIRGPGGGGKQLGAQHSQSLESYFVHCPGIKVVMPSTPEDAKGLLKESIRDDDPIVFLEHEHLYNT
ncbi:MAG: hypothetical protein JRI87_00530, partial [Deltaproteobacteria bacterium]|nr:hypothetical protein [Deltaproteobacteria bacterium]